MKTEIRDLTIGLFLLTVVLMAWMGVYDYAIFTALISFLYASIEFPRMSWRKGARKYTLLALAMSLVLFQVNIGINSYSQSFQEFIGFDQQNWVTDTLITGFDLLKLLL